MDVVAWLAIATGAVVGLVTGLVPGLHVNTLCAIALAVAPTAGSVGALGLSAAAASHAFAAVLPATFLGAPGEETLASALPAHRLLREGRGTEAVAVGLLGTLLGVAAAVVLLLPYKWILQEPGRLLAWLDAHMVFVLAALALFLVLREVPRGWRAAGGAVLVFGLSGWLGCIALGWSVAGWWAVPTTPLLPLLSGLFGAPALLEGLRRPASIPPQPVRMDMPNRLAGPLGRGLAASAFTAVLPGLTSAVAVAVAQAGRRADDDARGILATQAAIAGAHLVFSFGVLWLVLRPRTGLAVAVDALRPVATWMAGLPSADALQILQACLAGALLGAAGAWALALAMARVAHRLPGRLLAGAGLAATVALVAALSGAFGLLLFAIATVVGCLPLALGLGRLHLTGCLLLPVLGLRMGLVNA